MRKSIQYVSLGITVAIFIVLNILMKLFEFSTETQSSWVVLIIFAMIAVVAGVVLYMFIRSKNKNKLKL